MTIKSLEVLVSQLQQLKKRKKLVVVAAHSKHIIEAVVMANNDGLVESILIGKKNKIEKILKEFQENPEDYIIIDTSSDASSISTAIELIKDKKADFLMKGNVETPQLIKEILNKEHHLYKQGLVSSLGLFELPRYHKLIAVTDVGINMYPDVNSKAKIIKNAVDLMHKIGNAEPLVAVLSAVEKVNPKMPDTIDAGQLKEMNQNGQITGCIIEGPISFDLAVNAEAAKIKKYESPVAGNADLLVVPDIVSGNILVKAMGNFGDSISAGIVLGCEIPIVFGSRSNSALAKYYSIALAAYVS